MNSQGVEYIVVGGHAVAYHGHPRFTADIDFFVRPVKENAERIIAALTSFGFPVDSALPETLITPGKVVQLGRPPNRIDILTAISGVDFAEAFAKSTQTDFDGIPIRIIGLEALLKNKRASGRPKDLADLDQLKKIARKRKSLHPEK